MSLFKNLLKHNKSTWPKKNTIKVTLSILNKRKSQNEYGLYLDQINFKIYYYLKRVLLTSDLKTLLKHYKLNNYFLKNSNVSISNTLITSFFINKYLLFMILKVSREHSLTFPYLKLEGVVVLTFHILKNKLKLTSIDFVPFFYG